MTWDEWRKEFETTLIALAMTGNWHDRFSSDMVKARRTVDIIPEMPELMKKMFDAAQPNATVQKGTVVVKQPTPQRMETWTSEPLPGDPNGPTPPGTNGSTGPGHTTAGSAPGAAGGATGRKGTKAT